MSQKEQIATLNKIFARVNIPPASPIQILQGSIKKLRFANIINSIPIQFARRLDMFVNKHTHLFLASIQPVRIEFPLNPRDVIDCTFIIYTTKFHL